MPTSLTVELLEMEEQDSFALEQAVHDDMGGPAGKCHDWRNHVPCGLCCLWPKLSIETRMAIALIAEIAASNEVWD